MTRLEQLRIDSGLSYDKLAELTGVSSRTIRRAEKRSGKIRPENLFKLAQHFEVRATELLLEAELEVAA